MLLFVLLGKVMDIVVHPLGDTNLDFVELCSHSQNCTLENVTGPLYRSSKNMKRATTASVDFPRINPWIFG